MTTPSGKHYDLSATEMEQIGRVVGPVIREGMRDELSGQTDEIRVIVERHETNVRKMVEDHEAADVKSFDSISEKLTAWDARMATIEKKIAYAAGALGVILTLVPIAWDLAKHYFKIN